MNDHTAPDVTLRQASVSEKPRISAMLQDYLREFRTMLGEPDTLEPIPYPYLDAYWTDEGIAQGRVPFLILHGNEVAGFALRTARSRLGHSGPTSNVAEFYVAPDHRRLNVGRHAACALFDRFPGRWEVAQLRANIPAQYFWRTVISDYTGGEVEEHDVASDQWDGPIQVFMTPA